MSAGTTPPFGLARRVASAPPDLRSVISVALAVAVVLPLFLPLPGFEQVPFLAEAASVIAAFVILPAQLAADVTGPRPGSAMRLVVMGMVVTAVMAFAAGAVVRNPSSGTALSLLNWIALGALVVCGQTFLGSAAGARRLMRYWVLAYVFTSICIVGYLVIRFGGQLITSENRGPFQTAVRSVMPPWPNYFGTSLAVAVCYPFAWLLIDPRMRRAWLPLAILGVAVLATFSRTAMVATAGGLMVMAAASGRARRAVPIVLVTLVVAFLSSRIPAVRYQFVATFASGTSQQAGVAERYAYVVEALHLWRVHPLFGIGFGNFFDYADPYRILQHAGTKRVSVGSVHNEYVTTLLKGGILVAAGFALVLVAAVRAFLRALRSTDDTVRVLGLTGIGIMVVLGLAGLFAESFRTLSASAPFWVLLGSVSVIGAGGAMLPGATRATRGSASAPPGT
jgi:O-antigen ligase